MRNVFVAICMASVLMGCATSGVLRNIEHITSLQSPQKSEYFAPGTYKYKQVGLEASAAGNNMSTRLGQVAMDKLVKEAALGPNQLLVNMTVERGITVKTVRGKSDTLNIVTIRGDVIELGTPPTSSVKPNWGAIPGGDVAE